MDALDSYQRTALSIAIKTARFKITQAMLSCGINDCRRGCARITLMVQKSRMAALQDTPPYGQRDIQC